ncbi:MAG: prephenate dehydrogenase/arogenate dehydrogenase family protein [Aquificae bacterium]|nr:prephenate dehydrogenase/arogenate dehydrogenase family protein [Aquificota bacterium]
MNRVLIVGVGFMGGSFALALRQAGFKGKILGYDINPQSIEKALSLGVIDEGSTVLSEFSSCPPDFVILSSPVRTFKKIALQLRDLLPEDSTVTDQGSVKGSIVYELEEILGSRFVGGHPIAGTEKSGVEHSFPDLYRGKKVILTPTERTDKKRLQLVKEVWQRVGGVVEYMSPELHDYVFGAVSHLPHAVAFSLVDTLIKMSTPQVNLFLYPGAGFKDFTRIAKSDPVMWRDIFLANKENVLRAIRSFMDSLSELERLIVEEKEEELTEYLKEVKTKRMEID